MTKIKICGITDKQDAINAASINVDMIGFVFYRKSKRYIDPEIVRDIVNEMPGSIEKVGVFVDEDPEKVCDIVSDCSLDVLQFHGDESPGYCSRFKDTRKTIKAFRIKDKNSLRCINDYDTDFYLLDTYSAKLKGGTGKSFDYKMLEDFEFLKPVILSGSITPENVAEAIQKVAPYGVDVSSGVESSPGKKDLDLMKRFVEKIRSAS